MQSVLLHVPLVPSFSFLPPVGSLACVMLSFAQEGGQGDPCWEERQEEGTIARHRSSLLASPPNSGSPCPPSCANMRCVGCFLKSLAASKAQPPGPFGNDQPQLISAAHASLPSAFWQVVLMGLSCSGSDEAMLRHINTPCHSCVIA